MNENAEERRARYSVRQVDGAALRAQLIRAGVIVPRPPVEVEVEAEVETEERRARNAPVFPSTVNLPFVMAFEAVQSARFRRARRRN